MCLFVFLGFLIKLYQFKLVMYSPYIITPYTGTVPQAFPDYSTAQGGLLLGVGGRGVRYTGKNRSGSIGVDQWALSQGH